ncbi:MAG: ABC transporter ATP-binding protein [Chitinophagaceae bacterium]|nr:ABC transporter ATP-binding protein [Chitinophagaceae bacterium]
MSDILKVRNLTKDFKELRAVDDLSFSVKEGEVYGFLGQNGAGKSTTIRMLLTLIAPTDGYIEIFGMPLHQKRKEILRQVGAIIEKPDLYRYLTGFENIRLFSRLSGVKTTDNQIREELARVGLADRAESKVRTYSQGMKQRLGLACALVHNPKLIILDEPTNGLDPQGIADMRRMIIHLSKDLGKTLLVSSHLLSEMEMVADSMLIINKGRKVVEGKVQELINPVNSIVELKTSDTAVATSFLENSSWKTCLLPSVNGTIRLDLKKTDIPEFNRQLVAHGVAVQSLRPVHSLEEFFLSQTRE